MSRFMGLLALVAVAALVGCAGAWVPAKGRDIEQRCFQELVASDYGTFPPGPCTLSGTVFTCEGPSPWTPLEGAVVRISFHDERSSEPERIIDSTVTDCLGHYLFINLPMANYPNKLRVTASMRGSVGGYCLEWLLSPSPFHQTVLDFRLCESAAGWLTFSGNPPNIDPTDVGGGAVVTADPRTGEPTYHPY